MNPMFKYLLVYRISSSRKMQYPGRGPSGGGGKGRGDCCADRSRARGGGECAQRGGLRRSGDPSLGDASGPQELYATPDAFFAALNFKSTISREIGALPCRVQSSEEGRRGREKEEKNYREDCDP